jgi:hypothetical protein
MRIDKLPSSRRYRLVQETHYDLADPLDLVHVLARFRTQRATGTLVIELNQGGVRGVHFREETRAFVEA